MKYWTWLEIRTKVQRDLDLEGESFITGAELLGYANEAIDEVERQVLTLCEDYFITRSVLTLVPGQEEYSLQLSRNWEKTLASVVKPLPSPVR